MPNAQEWLDKEYPLEKRTEITELNINKENLEGELKLIGFFKLKTFDCGWNKLTNLDLNNCYELAKILCQGNSLTSTNFLATLLNPEKLVDLYIGDNNFIEQDLGFLGPFNNLEILWIWSVIKERIDKGLYNRFRGSLKHLQNMKNLKKLGIANTDIDDGLEYLAESKLEIFTTEWYPWENNVKFSGKRNGAGAEKLFAELRPYAIDIKKGKYDFSAWNNAKLIELSWEVEKLQSQLSRQEVQVNFLIEDLKSIGDEFLVKKKEESALLVNAIKEKLDESLHGYLEIFLDVQIGDNITEIVKKSLHGKINERELRQLSTKKVEIIRLERQLTKLTNLQNQENQQQTFLQARIQIPPK